MCIALWLWGHEATPNLQLLLLFNRDETLERCRGRAPACHQAAHAVLCCCHCCLRWCSSNTRQCVCGLPLLTLLSSASGPLPPFLPLQAHRSHPFLGGPAGRAGREGPGGRRHMAGGGQPRARRLAHQFSAGGRAGRYVYGVSGGMWRQLEVSRAACWHAARARAAASFGALLSPSFPPTAVAAPLCGSVQMRDAGPPGEAPSRGALPLHFVTAEEPQRFLESIDTQVRAGACIQRLQVCRRGASKSGAAHRLHARRSTLSRSTCAAHFPPPVL